MYRQAFRILVTTCAICYVLMALAATFRGGHADFKAYYYAPIAAQQDLNPYSKSDLSLVAQDTILFPYVYPPLTILLFRPLSCMTINHAFLLFSLAKCIALGIVFFVWITLLRPYYRPVFVLLFSLLAFSGSFFLDFAVGNINTFEQALLWGSLYLYCKQRYTSFALLICVAALCKLTPLFFLTLLLVPRVHIKPLFYALVALIAIVLVHIIAFNDLTYLFVDSIRCVPFSVFKQDLSLRALLIEFIRNLKYMNIATISESLAAPLTVIIVAAIHCAVLIRHGYGLSGRSEPKDETDNMWYTSVCMVSSLVYMLAVPRLLVYQCMVAIPGCLYVVARMQRKGLVFLSLAMLLLLSTQEIHNSLPVVKYLVCDFYRFAPTFALLLVLLTWLYEPLHMNTAFGGRAFTRDTCDECQQSAALVREARSGPRAGEP